MKKITITNLTFIEELVVSMFFCNVEKFKYLTSLDFFTPSLLTNPQKIGNRNLSPFTITVGNRSIFVNADNCGNLYHRNEEIAQIIEHKFGIPLDIDLDLRNDNDSTLFEINSFMRTLYPEKKLDFDLCDAIGELDALWAKQLLQNGANPTVPMYEDKQWSAFHELLSRTKLCRNSYDPGKEDWDKLITSLVNFFPHYVMREQMVTLVSRYISKEDRWRIEQEVDAKWKKITEPKQKQEVTLPESIRLFLDAIDKPNAVLAVMDDDKNFYYSNLDIYYSKILEYIMTSLKYVKIRVGGNSYRVANYLSNHMREHNYPANRFVYLNCDKDNMTLCTSDKVKTINMWEYDFKKDSDFVTYASEFDIRGYGEHSMVWYYVNNIDTGWYNKDGSFSSFNTNIKGLWALTEVALIKGFDDIEPATACIFANSNSLGKSSNRKNDDLHIQRLTLPERQEKLCTEQAVPYINLAKEVS